MIRIVNAPADFTDWKTLFELLRSSFAYMASRIDPPSSLNQMDAASLAHKAQQEELILAYVGDDLAGCVFAKLTTELVYVGKMAVAPQHQGRGIARLLMQAVESLAVAHQRTCIELETRIELTENHRAFAALGFVKTEETAHPGYERPTGITMRKMLNPQDSTDDATLR